MDHEGIYRQALITAEKLRIAEARMEIIRLEGNQEWDEATANQYEQLANDLRGMGELHREYIRATNDPAKWRFYANAMLDALNMSEVVTAALQVEHLHPGYGSRATFETSA